MYPEANYSYRFEEIIIKLFELMDYEVEREPPIKNLRFDFFVKEPANLYVEVKFYRSRTIPAKTLKELANRLAFLIVSNLLGEKNSGSGLVVSNAVVPEILKEEILEQYGIEIWDRETIYHHLTRYSIELRDEFEQLLLAVQQGDEIYDVFSGMEAGEAPVNYEKSKRVAVKPKYKDVPVNRGEKLCRELSAVVCGRPEWAHYEAKCMEVLKYLFDDDMTLWVKQSRSDDGLSRFDLICRIASSDDYWKALVSSFNTRFVLFEFKNYCDPITQNQVYTTERYLYIRGLRSVGFIITRKGGDDGAIWAAKGALKENGKLIMILTDEDLCRMLTLKDAGDSANDYLSNLLDSWLISLSR